MTPTLTKQSLPIVCGEMSEDIKTLINYQSFIYLADADKAILLDKQSSNCQPHLNTWQEHCF